MQKAERRDERRRRASKQGESNNNNVVVLLSFVAVISFKKLLEIEEEGEERNERRSSENRLAENVMNSRCFVFRLACGSYAVIIASIRRLLKSLLFPLSLSLCMYMQ